MTDLEKRVQELEAMLEDACYLLDGHFSALNFDLDDPDDVSNLADDLPLGLDNFWRRWRGNLRRRERAQARRQAAYEQELERINQMGAE